MMTWEMYCIELENTFNDDMGDVYIYHLFA